MVANRLAVASLIGTASIGAMPVVAQPSLDCNAPASEAGLKAHVPGHPFAAIASHDGCWLFVSLKLATDRGGITVLHRMAGTLTQTPTTLLSGPLPAGMALTHDGALLIVPDGSYVYFLDTDRLIHDADPVIGKISDGDRADAINAVTTSDDRLLFVSDESLHQVTVIDLAQARQNGYGQRAIVGRIPTGRAPVGLALSSNDEYLFITSEVLPKLHSSATCRSEGQKGGTYEPDGALEVVSIARLQPKPEKAIVGAVTAGCSPVRTALSERGDRLYVTARASDALLVFDPAALVSDPAHALLATVPVGNAPVGVALLDQGRRVVVANSGRFGGAGGRDLTVVDASRVDQGGDAVVGTVAVGHFPRELHVTDDGKTLLVTDFDSDQIELLSIDQLPTRKDINLDSEQH